MSEKFYLTTPIYYPSGKWHLGHCYTTVYGDAIARYKRMSGYDVFYLTGTDEHGQKIEQRAAAANVTPKEFVDGLVDDIKRLWKLMDISYDKFIRTTDEYHVKAVQKIFRQLYDNGDIYKSTYKGKYCTPCEAFWTETQLVDGKCPDCGREVVDAEEESYFFRLTKYADRVRRLLTETDFLEPKSRVNEMVNNFIDNELTDLAVSRTSFKWGVPVEFDPGHIVYVWVDALSNYITALGYGSDDTSLLKRYWPADLHLMAKEIVRFHSVIWPAILMALGMPVPKKVIGHGWLVFDGDKMSKSKGNVADPFVLAERYGVDPLRYYLLRAMPFGADGNYSDETFLNRVNADLVNDLGNLVKRTLAMSKQYFDGKVTSEGQTDPVDEPLVAMLDGLKAKVDAHIDRYMPNRALEEIFGVIAAANKYIDTTAPWVLFREGKKARLEAVIYNLLEALRITGLLLAPFLTDFPVRIYKGLGLTLPDRFDSAVYGAVKNYATEEQPPLIKRLDVAKETAELAALRGEETKQKDVIKPEKEKKDKKEEKPMADEQTGIITIDEFFRTQLKVARVIACEKVEKADKLLKLTLDAGGETRTVVSGIAKSYTPEQMVGRQVVLVANLKPVKLRGIESQGMILCATDGEGVSLVSPDKTVDPGSEVC